MRWQVVDVHVRNMRRTIPPPAQLVPDQTNNENESVKDEEHGRRKIIVWEPPQCPRHRQQQEVGGFTTEDWELMTARETWRRSREKERGRGNEMGVERRKNLWVFALGRGICCIRDYLWILFIVLYRGIYE